MQMEAMFLRSKGSVGVGSYFGDRRVTWAGGWTSDKLSFLVMVARPRVAMIRRFLSPAPTIAEARCCWPTFIQRGTSRRSSGVFAGGAGRNG